MSLGDRETYTERMRRLNGTAPLDSGRVGVANGVSSNGGSKTPGTLVIGPADRPLAVDRPKTSLSPDVIELKHRLHDRMVREIDPTRLTVDLAPEDARRAVEDAVAELLRAENANISRTD